MTIERVLTVLYLIGCIAVGLIASRKVSRSSDEYWVAGRKIGPVVNSMAIMAALASGGSIIGVMGLAYATGIPATLALFTGASIGFPIAALLVAGPLRKFGKFTITDFMVYRYPHAIVRYLVPILIVVSFTAYIIAQMKVAGITANALLGIPYDTALTLATLVFITYVSLGGMLAITWTDVFQGTLMLFVVIGAALLLMFRIGSPMTIMEQATAVAPELGRMGTDQGITSYLGSFVIWASAISVIPHIVMRVFTAKDSRSAKLSLNLSMVFYAVLILAAVLAITPVGKMNFPELQDADTVFLRVIETEFHPFFRGIAVAAVLAAVMSTTDALLLACSSAIAHDLLGNYIEKRLSHKTGHWITVGVAWAVGLVAMSMAYDPPALVTEFYTIAIGLLSAGLFVPVIAGLWWKKANLAGGIASLLGGVTTYAIVQYTPSVFPAGSAILMAIPASTLLMWIGGTFAPSESATMIAEITELHRTEEA